MHYLANVAMNIHANLKRSVKKGPYSLNTLEMNILKSAVYNIIYPKNLNNIGICHVLIGIRLNVEQKRNMLCLLNPEYSTRPSTS